ncbi:MAG: 3-deoxy-manno-octulosonate cytidylyltransferase [Bacteroidales bacterium]|nr:3-deoxy-manno-octulosonate cytidylyltransferase [Bacteroidales bacterium]
MKILGIIPARYASTRFPGKPLALIDGKPMIEHVWRGVTESSAVSRAIVATDDSRIAEAVRAFGGEVMMTGEHHRSGTDRCGEVVKKLVHSADCYDVVINIQGDEPRVAASQLRTVAAIFDDPKTEIATLKKSIASPEELFSPNVVKVVCNPSGDALYFSRQPIPYLRNTEKDLWLEKQKYYKHIGIYAFRLDILESVTKLAQTPLELSESLEQLRWLENGFRISVRETDVENIAIDTPEDLLKLQSPKGQK